MLENAPGRNEMIRLTGEKLYSVWERLCGAIDEKYDMERTWNTGGKKWVYEYKYRRGGKTLCALYARENLIGLMIIFGGRERDAFEAVRHELSGKVCKEYDRAETYHDGKWVMFEPEDASLFDDYLKLLTIKRKPNRIASPPESGSSKKTADAR